MPFGIPFKQRISQTVTALVYNAYLKGFFLGTIYQGNFKLFNCPGFNCYSCPGAVFACPIGVMQFFISFKPYVISFFTLGLIGAIASVGGRIVCGWACPFGFIQDLLYKIKSPKWDIPVFLSKAKYLVVIVLVLIIPFYTKEPWFCKLCPAGTLEAGIPHVLYNPDLRQLIGIIFELKMLILIIFVAWMVVSRRPFCRTTCPLGAIYSLFNKISMLRLEVDKNHCSKCEKCFKQCPMSIKIYQEGCSTTECIRCFRCTDCPSDAVKFTFSVLNK